MRDEFRQHYATKADLGALETKLIKWMVGVQIAGIAALATVVAAFVAIMKLLGS